MQAPEGVIQFDLRWRETEPVEADLSALGAWRRILWKLALVGEDPARYGGYGFGNVSQRYGATERFIISGTQTGHMECLGAGDYALVTAFDPAANRVYAEGPARPSSEAMTHGIIYTLDESTDCILHVHSPEIWNAASSLNLPQTHADVPYGTPEMAAEVERLFEETDVRVRRIFAMAGHPDGVVAFGPAAEDAGTLVVQALADTMY